MNQRQAASHADDTYCFDRWFVLTESGAIAASALIDPEIGQPTGIRLTQTHASAQRFAIAQIVESADSRDLRARGRDRAPSTSTARFAAITGALSVTLVMPNSRVGVLRFTAATSFDGAAGALGNVLFGSGVSIG